MLTGSLVVSASTVNVAQAQIVRPLPPPPANLPNPGQTPAQRNIPTIFPSTPNSNPTGIPQSFPANNNFSPTSSYRVYVYSTNPRLLEQVRFIEPGAFIRRREGVIQAGLFTRAENAQRRVRQLATRGINATVAAPDGRFNNIQSTTIPPTTNTRSWGDPLFDNRAPNNNYPQASSNYPNYPQVNNNSYPGYPQANNNNYPGYPQANNNARSPYFVIIPGNRGNLQEIASEVIRLGTSQEYVQQRESPLGTHVAIGPFASQDLAQKWNSYFRDAGLDARLHFER